MLLGNMAEVINPEDSEVTRNSALLGGVFVKTGYFIYLPIII